ncbi:hypothetical protein A7U60_g3718 [Sanghuangporus baumii]|uniref:Uncharacterized protein n=1 Tax=Sanghuangporus baumii TaxID=108892 RepID=A0A9Q5NCX3_SANBA|nr:hypothetical protein A7U60_g3718 [Sanghuangporus baumii]
MSTHVALDLKNHPSITSSQAQAQNGEWYMGHSVSTRYGLQFKYGRASRHKVPDSSDSGRLSGFAIPMRQISHQQIPEAEPFPARPVVRVYQEDIKQGGNLTAPL